MRQAAHVLLFLGIVVILAWSSRSFGATSPAKPNAQIRDAAYVRGVLAAVSDPSEVVAGAAILDQLNSDKFHLEVRERIRELAQGPLLLKLLHSRDSVAMKAAVKMAALLGERAKEQAPLVAELLKDSDSDVRAAAIRALGAMKEGAKEYSPRVAALLKHSHPSVREAAAMALGAMGEGAQEHAPRMVELLRDSHWSVREAAAIGLGGMGEGARKEAPRVAELLEDSDLDVRAAAAFALGVMGAKEYSPRLAALLKHSHPNVREVATIALGEMGKEAKEQAPRVVELLKDSEHSVRRTVARALRSMGEGAKEQVPRVAELLKHSDSDVREAAVRSLGAMGEGASAQAPLVAELLKDSHPDVREEAAKALGAMGEGASAQAPLVAELLKDPGFDVRQEAAKALGAMGGSVAEQVPLVAELLKHSDSDVREVAVKALGTMGKGASAQAPLVAKLLKDPDSDVRQEAAKALGAMGEGASAQAPLVAELLKDPDSDVRQEAAKALGAMGESAAKQAPLVAELLKDSDWLVRQAAAIALGTMGEGAVEQAPLLAERLMDSAVEDEAAKALELMAPLTTAVITSSLAKILEDRRNRARWMVHAHIVGRGDESIERVLRWVGRTSDEKPTSLTIEEARGTLNAFLDLWPHSSRHRILQDALAENIAAVASLNRSDWADLEDLGLLGKHVDNLRKMHSVQADTVQGVITAHTYWRRLSDARWLVLTQLSLWLLLIFAYPYSSKVQAIFFWHPWVRRFLGFGYVGVLLVLVPFLRRRLLSPFRQQLLADANLDGFFADGYFSRSEVLVAHSGERKRLLDALPELKGKNILEGASGLGKSMFLKYLLSRSKRLAVYLPAERCKNGVLDAIQAKLEGIAGDAGFLKSVIHSGALDIYIDGLNEVTADTRTRIVDFVDGNFHGNILLATQRIDWTPPAAARLYMLQSLSDAEIVVFLVGREPLLGDAVRLRGAVYTEKCRRFVEEALSPAQSEFHRRAMREVLSNPMDLTVVAQMLANDQVPDLSNLGQQQYELMAKGYLEIVGTEFPLGRFCEEAYQMRLEGRSSLDEARFSKELSRMEEARMVLLRHWRAPDGNNYREWRFRHDKIQEFFIAQTFLAPDSQRDTRHMDDSRFRGVYLLLASLLPLERARVLRDVLVERAAETGDHSVSDDFVKLLKVREAAEKAHRGAAGGAGAVVVPLHQHA